MVESGDATTDEGTGLAGVDAGTEAAASADVASEPEAQAAQPTRRATAVAAIPRTAVFFILGDSSSKAFRTVDE
jgi:hypothetical protein